MAAALQEPKYDQETMTQHATSLPILLPRRHERPTTTATTSMSGSKQLLAHGVGRAFDIVMKKGKGSWVWTSDDRKLLDFTSGVCVTNLGHSHPRVVRAAQQQIETLAHGMMNVAYHEPILELAERLVPLMPDGLNSLVFATSGAESIENAVKLARHATGKQNIIVFQVQSGFGRTGEYFATNGHFDVVPDILVVAKGIANGFPLSVVASRKDLTDLQVPGAMGGTYAGNPVSCAAAIATQDVIRDELVLENTKARSRQFFAGLERFKASGKYPILDVRGLGLMVAIEFDAKAVPVGTAARISQSCLAHGMMVLTTSIFETLRFMPPLTVSAEECDLGLEIFEKALQDVFQQSVLDHEQ
ncbi:4-aminobutyrate transaminase, partial [Globisporangium splendens]